MWIDTGTGSNCLEKSAIAPVSEEAVSLPANTFGKGANGSSVDIESQFSLALRVGAAVIKIPFSVCDSLLVDALLGPGILDRHVRHIYVKDHRINLKDGTDFPILRSTFSQQPAYRPSDTCAASQQEGQAKTDF